MYKFVILTTAAVLALSLPAAASAQEGRGNDGNKGDKGNKERGSDNREGRGQQDRGNGRGDRNDDRPVAVVREGRGDRDVTRNLERNAERDVRRDIERDIDRRVLDTDAGRVAVLSRDRGRGLIAGCPPGLAKKNNGCLPPGQARRIERERFDYLWSSRDDAFNYRYDDGFLYRLNRQGSLLGYMPVLGGALSMGNIWPGQYDYQPVPRSFADYYGLTDRYDYRYADGAVYGLDPRTQAISQVAALLTGQQVNIGQTMPAGFDVYNVPYAYRDRYRDTADARYRYNDGQVYRIDPTTQLVQAVIQLLT
ncbi:hypothetical protein [Brevundimonas sp.]|uniref:hypothetical protein n=1 Tax=Brevundimonas sp. TaxID=1871086 RepID=UPI003563D647